MRDSILKVASIPHCKVTLLGMGLTISIFKHDETIYCNRPI